MRGSIQLKRVYEPAGPEDGARLLVDRLWPRGVKNESLALAGWRKDVAPSDALRRWFGHDPAKWAEFERRYSAELAQNPVAWQPIADAARRGPVTLLFAARDVERNNAVVLKRFLEKQGRPSKTRSGRSRRSADLHHEISAI